MSLESEVKTADLAPFLRIFLDVLVSNFPSISMFPDAASAASIRAFFLADYRIIWHLDAPLP